MDSAEDNEIELDINQRNFSNIDDKCKLLHVYTNETTNKKCAIIEVTSNIYKHIKDNKSRIFVGHQNCRVFDLIITTPCNKCARFGHSSKKCENIAMCYKCAEAHLPTKCTSTTNKSANCVYRNAKFNTKYDINHSTIDSELCEILKSKIKKSIETTDYPTTPTYSRYFGMVERLPFPTEGTDKESEICTLDSTTSQNSRIAGTPTPIRNAMTTTPINQNG